LTNVAMLKAKFKRMPDKQLREIQDALDAEFERRESNVKQARRY